MKARPDEWVRHKPYVDWISHFRHVPSGLRIRVGFEDAGMEDGYFVCDVYPEQVLTKPEQRVLYLAVIKYLENRARRLEAQAKIDEQQAARAYFISSK